MEHSDLNVEQLAKFSKLARSEARKLVNKLGKALKFYEEDDFVNWAYVSKYWMNYLDDGDEHIMRIALRFAMIRAMSESRGSQGKKFYSWSFDQGIPYRVLKRYGLIDKNLPDSNAKFKPIESPDELESMKAEDPIDVLIRQELYDTLRVLTGCLPDKQKEAIEKRVNSGATFKEIGKEMGGISSQAVNNLYNRGVTKIRKELNHGNY